MSQGGYQICRPRRHPSWKQDAKTFLRKVMIVRENFGEALTVHHLHRDAIRQAIGLIRPRFIEGKAIQEARTGLRDDCGVGMLEGRPHKAGRSARSR